MRISRTISVAAIAVSAVVALAGCASSTHTADAGTKAAPETISLFTNSDVGVQDLWTKTLIPAFEAKYPNITVKFSNADASTDAVQLAKIAASAKSGKGSPMDVIIDASFIADASEAGLLKPISKTTIPNLANVTENMLGTHDEIPYRGSAVILAYDSAKVAAPPTTLPKLIDWIKAHPGQFTYNNPSTGGSGQGFVQAVLDSGMDEASVTKMATGYDVKAQSKWKDGFDVLKSLTPAIYQQHYPDGNTGSLNLLGTGEVSMVPSWSDIFLTAKKAGSLGKSVKAVSISGPAMPGGASYLAIPKNSAHVKAAETLLNWVLDPAQQAQMVSQIAGFPVIPKTDLPADTQSVLKGLDTEGGAQFYSSKSAADMNSKWMTLVP
ncbi:extracellular solute-binding protein [Lacisediminihabitans changchengi]|uniref:Extracellular solute-binding protein n=1 Tax=Lacisediminihabitans changchengi TaxID=2787634 RepID=A0A934SJ37_9MICO|nr:extracellular solute-binding protein [Lacisediminihabitans changchengi]MBK4346299.1 extracellular solute-binding protein [Lacisediminihabitans changchengi]